MRLVNLTISWVFSQHCERGSIRQDGSPIFSSLANRRCSRSERGGRRRRRRSDIELICCCGFGSLFPFPISADGSPSPFLFHDLLCVANQRHASTERGTTKVDGCPTTIWVHLTWLRSNTTLFISHSRCVIQSMNQPNKNMSSVFHFAMNTSAWPKSTATASSGL